MSDENAGAGAPLMSERLAEGAGGWPLRAWGLAALGCGVGLVIHFVLPEGNRPAGSATLALATFVGVAALALAYVVERSGAALSVGFAIAAGAVVASVVNQGGDAGFGNGGIWRLVCAGLAVAIAAPLFQAWRDRGWPLAYPALHDRAWINLVLWFASFAFAGLVWAMAWLLAVLFDLIGIDVLEKLLERRIVALAVLGGALGGGIGLLRDRDAILGTLQRVVLTVLAVLAPALGLGLLLFIAALPFTGLEPLWSATKATTPILLACVIGALVLANAVIGDAAGSESRQPVLRWGAMALAAALPVLGVIAAISVGARIAQHGLTPDRLWAMVFTAIACAYGAAALYALGQGRLARWPALLRRGNVHLALGLCAAALVLSTPLIDFGAISTRDQVARLERGAVKLADFDWEALRFDFGPAGEAAVARLVKSGATTAVRQAAAVTLASKDRYAVIQQKNRDSLSAGFEQRVLTVPVGVTLPADLRDHIIAQGDCASEERFCVVVHRPGAARAVVFRSLGDRFAGTPQLLARRSSGWAEIEAPVRGREVLAAERARLRAALLRGAAEIREVRRRQLFIDGKPEGEPFDEFGSEAMTPSGIITWSSGARAPISGANPTRPKADR